LNKANRLCRPLDHVGHQTSYAATIGLKSTRSSGISAKLQPWSSVLTSLSITCCCQDQQCMSPYFINFTSIILRLPFVLFHFLIFLALPLY